MDDRNEVERLRALVNYDTPAGSNPQDQPNRVERAQVLRIVGIAVAALIVIASLIFTVLLLKSELIDDDPTEVAVVPNAEPTPAPAPTTTDTDTTTSTPVPEPTAAPVSDTTADDPFKELRYLPSDATDGLELQSLLRVSDAAPLLSIVRSNGRSELTGIVLVDSVGGSFVEGLGVQPADEIDIDGEPAQIAESGPILSHVISWNHPTLGPLQAWGLGVTASEHGVVVDALFQGFATNERAAPEGWEVVDSYTPADSREIWRAYYLGAEGELAVVTSSVGDGPGAACTATDTAWIDLVNRLDDDGVEITTFASADRVRPLADSLRPVAASNARIRSSEAALLAETKLVDARRQLYVPEPDSEWKVTETLAHYSGRAVTEPVLVMIERDTPEIGTITSAVVVDVLPEGGVDLVEETLGEGRTRVVFEAGDVLLEARGWNHTLDEIRLIADLISLADDGVQFASRAASSIGLERRYDAIYASPFPRRVAEGVVFAAAVQNEFDDIAVIRVSLAPSFEPTALAVLPRSNERVQIMVRGHAGSFIVDQGVATLTWEERSGTLIEVSGPETADLVALAESLELVGVDDLSAASS